MTFSGGRLAAIKGVLLSQGLFNCNINNRDNQRKHIGEPDFQVYRCLPAQAQQKPNWQQSAWLIGRTQGPSGSIENRFTLINECMAFCQRRLNSWNDLNQIRQIPMLGNRERGATARGFHR